MLQPEEGKEISPTEVMGRVAPRVMGREARKILRVEEAMGMAMGAEGMEIGKTGEDKLRWPMTTLQGFSRRGIPLHQIRLSVTCLGFKRER
jgi:hypothetical protein